jgi:hypothetical protein
VSEDDDLRPAPEIEPRLAPDHAELGELGARTLLRALARSDPRVHQEVAVAGDEGREGAEPPEPLVERGAELGPDLIQGGRGAALEQRDLVIAEDGEGLQASGELQDSGTVGTAIDEVAAEGELVMTMVESGRAEQIAQLSGTALHVADEEDVPHTFLVTRAQEMDRRRGGRGRQAKGG